MAGGIRAIIFDIGGVLVKHNPKKVFAGRGRTLLAASPGGVGWNNPKAEALLLQFELGGLTARQFYRKITPFMRREISFAQFKRQWAGIFIWKPAAAAFAKRLKKSGYKIGIVSNIDPLNFRAIMRRYGLLPFVDFAAASFLVHARKPARGIFLAALKGLRLKPRQCVYIDDIPRYVAAAGSLGFSAVQFKSLPRLKKDLRRLGVVTGP